MAEAIYDGVVIPQSRSQFEAESLHPETTAESAALFTVIICTHAINRYDDTLDSINSVLAQSHNAIEIIVVVDRNMEVFNRLRDAYNSIPSVSVMFNDECPGLSGSRNLGIKRANGEFIAFLDDDAVADRHWLSSLLESYKDERVIGCGGPILPLWVSGKTHRIPEEFYWVMGCTYKGFRNEKRSIRSNFGSNMSFRKYAFDNDGFNVNLGIVDSKGVGEELEFSLRLLKKNPDCIILHVPESIVRHKIFEYRKSIKHLFSRSIQYGEGVGNHRKELEKLPAHVEKDDKNMMSFILLESVPIRIRSILRRETDDGGISDELIQLILVGFSSLLIVTGMIKGQIRRCIVR